VRILHYTLVTLCSFATALFLAWKLLLPFDYGYSFLYKKLDIAEHIQTFAPLNRQGKNGFENTSVEKHHQLFHEICVAINDGGKGLRQLSYQPSADAAEQTLLTEAEAIHLDDVSRLIDLMMPLGWIALVALILLIVIARAKNRALPSLGYSIMILIIIALLLMVVIVIVGPHEVFKSLHELVFPDDHQWFFYYQDSLMTTLMKAPDIFFAIAVLWAILATIIYIAIAALMKLISPKNHYPRP